MSRLSQTVLAASHATICIRSCKNSLRLEIVQTVRGAAGGVQLAKPPRDVRIGWLVRALEADQSLVECFRADHGCCTLEPGCRLRPMLRKARESFFETLDAFTLADCLGSRRREPSGEYRAGPPSG